MKTQIICSVLLFGLVSALPAPQFFCVSFSNLTVVSFLTALPHSNQHTRQHDDLPSPVGCWDNYVLGWRMGIDAYTEPEREQLYLVLKNEHWVLGGHRVTKMAEDQDFCSFDGGF
ncbi:hypothetical protein FA13DRAFT_1726816 [Coprinellus micaceus]|uniref:Uncharacterized protein n=1 Tax=Coprinellus micaceus TaxID=71717 RepID=A0A4Y7TSB5_COPMI|nr:hypothetical protein FA13DRAFT_1726816 [Coprinellus micaceus]